MEEKVLEVKISVSDEGIVFIDNITADMQALDESIENNSILMHYDSKNGYAVGGAFFLGVNLKFRII